MPACLVHPLRPKTGKSDISTTMSKADITSIPSSVARQQQQQLPLRRAVYIHVSDLTSAYNIDHARMEEELARVMAKQFNTFDCSSACLGGVPTELDTSASQRRLQPPRAGYNLCVLVGNVNVVVDKNRVDGSRVRLAEVEVGDETGTVSLRARDEQIDVLREVSARAGAVVLRNCTLELYQGKHIRLAITKWGKLSVYPDKVASTPPPPSKINRDKKFSLIDLSLVASEMVAFTTGNSPSTETENQSLSTVNRSPPYHANVPNSRRNHPRRHPTQTTQPMATLQAPMYSGSALQSTIPTRAYPGGLHGYGGIDAHYNMLQRQPENLSQQQHNMLPRQPENLSQQQQIMLQRQFEMQQRQIQMAYQHHIQPPEQRIPPQAGLFPAASFDSTFSGGGQEVPMPERNTNTYIMPIQASPHPDPSFSTLAPPDPGNLASAKMNPQAATFDPTSTTAPHKSVNKMR